MHRKRPFQIVSIAIAIAGSESRKITIDPSGNTINLASIASISSSKKYPGGFRCTGNGHFNFVSIAIAIAGSESRKITIDPSGNPINLASTVNLRNTYPDRFEILVLESLNF